MSTRVYDVDQTGNVLCTYDQSGAVGEDDSRLKTASSPARPPP